MWETIAEEGGRESASEGPALWSFEGALWRLSGAPDQDNTSNTSSGNDDEDRDKTERKEPVRAEVWRLAAGARAWERVPCTGAVPHAAANAAVCVLGGARVAVFGGLDPFSDELFSNALHVLDLRTRVWSQPAVAGTPPSPRDKCAACALGTGARAMLVVGGFGPVTRAQAEAVRKRRRLAEVAADGGDAADVAAAAAADAADEAADGVAPDAPQLLFTWFNDAFVLDTAAMAWRRCTPPAGGPSSSGSSTDSVPLERCAAALCATDDTHAVLFGGRCIDGDRANDCWEAVLTLPEVSTREDGKDDDSEEEDEVADATLAWRRLEPAGAAPEARSCHTMVAAHAHGRCHAVVCGGLAATGACLGDVAVLDLAACAWRAAAPSGLVPRENHRAALLPGRDGDGSAPRMAVYGGGADVDARTGAPATLLTDTLALDLAPLLAPAQC